MTRLRDLPMTVVIVASICVPLLTAVGLVAWASLDIARRNTVELTRDKAELVIASIIERTRDHLDPVSEQVTYLAGLISRGTVSVDDRQALGHMLQAALSATPQVAVMAFADAELQVLRALRNRTAAPVELKDWSDMPGFRAVMSDIARAGEADWGKPFFAESSGHSFLNLYMPVRRQGQFLGALIAGVSIGELSEFLYALDGEVTDSSFLNAFILYDKRFVLAHPLFQSGYPGLSDAQPLPPVAAFGDPVLQGLWSSEQRVPIDPKFLGRNQAHGIRLGAERYVALYRDLHGYGDEPWTVGTYARVADIAPQVARLGLIPQIMALVLGVALVLAVLLGRGLSRPIRQLAAAATRISDLDLSGPPLATRDSFREINQAAGAFNAMVLGLRSFETYVPRSLVRRIVRQHGDGPSASTERQVTILFTDIVGFTSLAETLPAAEVAEFLNQHFTLLGACVEAEEGTVDKYIGDALMAFWGAPEAQEDTAARACRTAQAIARAIEADNARRRDQAQPPVELRIGIHTGAVVVGNIGSPGRVNYTIVGDAVNTAQRLEALCKQLASDGAVRALVSATTAARLGPEFDLERLGTFEVKGKEEKIDVYRLV